MGRALAARPGSGGEQLIKAVRASPTAQPAAAFPPSPASLQAKSRPAAGMTRSAKSWTAGSSAAAASTYASAYRPLLRSKVM